MAKNDELLKKLRAGNLVENNGMVLRAINLLRHKYIDLKSVRRVHQEEVGEQDFLDCVNYLSQEDYIRLRDIASRQECPLSDAEYTTLEAMVTAKGIRLFGDVITDPMVDV